MVPLAPSPSADPPIGSAAAWYEPGQRWLVVAGRSMVVSEGTAGDAVDIWRAAASGAGAGDLLLTCVRRSVTSDGWSAPGAFAIAVAEPDAARILVRGIEDVRVLTGDGESVAVGIDGLLTWTEVMVPGAVEVRIGDADAVVLPVPVGVVRAGALRWGVPAGAADSVEPAGPVPNGPVRAGPPAGRAPTPFTGSQRSLEETRADLDPDESPRLIAAVPALERGAAPESVVEPAPPGGRVDTLSPDVADSAARFRAVSPIPSPEPAIPTPEPAIPSPEPATPSPAPPTEHDEPAAGHDESGAQHDEPAPVAAIPEFGSAHTDFDGDHDGMTQLAEDMPVGYTPPPLPATPPPGTVLAVLCPAGHPNAPHSRSCRLCGQLIVQSEPMPLPRPVLARIRLSTGEVVEVDRAIVIGRSPYVSRVAAADLPRLVAVPSPNQDISRAHAEIRPEDWHLVVADLESTNGTTVRAPGRTPQRLRPGQEAVVEPGWTVELGDGVSFVVEAV